MALLLASNVAGLLNVTSNISNTGNILVTQNTYTGNCIVTSLLLANANPLVNLATRAMTGISANLTANAQTNSNLAQTTILGCTFNETGMYAIEGMIFYGTTVSTNASNVGMNIGWGNTGTAKI